MISTYWCIPVFFAGAFAGSHYAKWRLLPAVRRLHALAREQHEMLTSPEMTTRREDVKANMAELWKLAKMPPVRAAAQVVQNIDRHLDGMMANAGPELQPGLRAFKGEITSVNFFEVPEQPN